MKTILTLHHEVYESRKLFCATALDNVHEKPNAVAKRGGGAVRLMKSPQALVRCLQDLI